MKEIRVEVPMPDQMKLLTPYFRFNFYPIPEEF